MSGTKQLYYYIPLVGFVRWHGHELEKLVSFKTIAANLFLPR